VAADLGRVLEDGPLYDLAGEMERHELGSEAAAEGLMAWIAWVEVQGFDDLVEGLRVLRGAVIVAGAFLVQ